jgi:hypothetical protein
MIFVVLGASSAHAQLLYSHSLTMTSPVKNGHSVSVPAMTLILQLLLRIPEEVVRNDDAASLAALFHQLPSSAASGGVYSFGTINYMLRGFAFAMHTESRVEAGVCGTNT